jgi:hypothetical protein
MFAVLVTLVAAASSQAQTQPAAQPAQAAAPSTPADVAGRYAGTFVAPDGPLPITAELKVESGVITGSIQAPTRAMSITGGGVTGEKFSLTIQMGGAAGSIAGSFKDGKFDGRWSQGVQGGAFTLARLGPGGAAAPGTAGAAAEAAKPPAAPAPDSAATDPLTGDWDAILDAGGNQMPFLLSIKLDGEKVTGQLASDMGTAPFEGTWTSGALSFAFSGPNGMAVSMSATIVDGKLAGTFSIADGQMTGGWAAAKRK